jgi:outer membrane protein assembly factor BamB
VVVALDAISGRPAWAYRYPQRESDSHPGVRDLAPAVYADGRLYVAPADSDRIICLSSTHGRPLWESRPVEVGHLLGIAGDRLIFTSAGRPRGIRAVAASTGDDLRSWCQPDTGADLPSAGRGVLAGGLVFWPTQRGLVLLDREDGQPADIDPTRLRHIRTGNLAVGDGCLAVADGAELTVYVPVGSRGGPAR